MNEFVAAAEAVAVEEAPVDAGTLVTRFLAGQNGSTGEFHAIDRNLYHKNKVVARLCPNGVVLTSEANLDDTKMNDAFVGTVYRNNRTLSRVKRFNNLASAKDRLSELDTGDNDSFTSIAGLFGFEFSAFDLDAVQRAKDFRARVQEHFAKIEADEAARVKAAEAKARADRLKGQLIEWDSGEGRASRAGVEGAGGGQRLRQAANPHRSNGRTYPAVETSTGQRTTVAQAKRAWDKATKHWHGGVTGHEGHYGQNYYITGGRSIDVHEDRVKFGCQTVTRKEAERFADVMSWDRAANPNQEA